MEMLRTLWDELHGIGRRVVPNLLNRQAVLLGLVALPLSVCSPPPGWTQSQPDPEPEPDYLHGSVSLGYDHSYGAGPVAPRLFVGMDWDGLSKDATWFIKPRLYQAFGEYDGVQDPRDALVLSLVQYPNRGLLDRGLLHGFVTALPFESRGSGFDWRSAQGAGLGIRPIKSQRLTLSAGVGPGFQYIDPTEAPTEVLFSLIYGGMAYGHLTDRLTYVTYFLGATGAPDRDFLLNISRMDYRLTSAFSAQIAVLSYLSEGVADGFKDFIGHARVALTYHLW